MKGVRVGLVKLTDKNKKDLIVLLSKKTILRYVLVFIVLLIGIAYFMSQMQVKAPAIALPNDEFAKRMQGVEPSEIAHELMIIADKYESSVEELPASLKGTSVDGGFRTDEQGHLIIDKSIQRYFDYFLATVGELTIAEIATYLNHQINQGLQEPARSEALKILEGYLAYKAALQEMVGQQTAEDGGRHNYLQLSERLDLLQQTRRDYLSAEVVDAFFAEEEAYGQYTLERLRIQQDDSLSQSQKSAQLDALQSMLPESMRVDHQENRQYENYQVELAKLKESGADSDAYYQLRLKMFGQEAADRFAEADRVEAQWQRQVSVYEEEKSRLKQAGLSDGDYKVQLTALRKQLFSDEDQVRIQAYDRGPN